MDIAFYSQEQDKIIIANGKKLKFKDYPKDKFTPIGVVVIPKEHNVYGDGSCGVMSICEMDYNMPQEGGISATQYMCWGDNFADISSLPNLDVAPICSSKTSNVVSGTYNYPYLPTTDTYNSSTGMSADGVAEYRTDTSYIAPSPYLADGSRNPSYYQTSAPSSTANALADFDGRGNTNKILAVRGERDYTTWKPGQYAETDFPAASCCDMFSTVGTEQGDWYLPSCGEFGYIIVRLKEINETLDKLKAAYPNTPIVGLLTDDTYWSSSHCNIDYARCLSTYSSCCVKDDRKFSGNFVRAFLRVGV